MATMYRVALGRRYRLEGQLTDYAFGGRSSRSASSRTLLYRVYPRLSTPCGTPSSSPLPQRVNVPCSRQTSTPTIHRPATPDGSLSAFIVPKTSLSYISRSKSICSISHCRSEISICTIWGRHSLGRRSTRHSDWSAACFPLLSARPEPFAFGRRSGAERNIEIALGSGAGVGRACGADSIRQDQSIVLVPRCALALRGRNGRCPRHGL